MKADISPPRHAEQDKSFVSRLYRVSKTIVASLVCIGLMVIGAVTLYVRSSLEPPVTANPPIVVTTQTIELEDQFWLDETFAGRLEPTRQTNIAFERQGLITRIIPQEGDKIDANAVIAELDTSKLLIQLQETEAQKKELTAQLNLADAILKRQARLQNEGWASVQRFDEARFQVEQLKASIERVKATISNLKVDIEKSKVKAPFAGTVAERLVDEGAVISPGTPILNLTEDGVKHIRVGTSPETANALEINKIYEFQSSNRPYKAKLISKRPDLETQTRTVTLIFATDDAKQVPYGEIFELIVRRPVPQTGTWLPITALSEGQKGLWSVFVAENKDEETVVTRRSIEILHTKNEKVFVRGGIKSGDLVILNGANRIIPGQNIVLAQS